MPLIPMLEALLEFGYALTGSYGFAIVILSILVNIILLPAYFLAEHLQKKELQIRNVMHDKLQEIRQCFTGQERFMMTQTLYRLHGYHPIMGLRSLFSLLIQIPFFLAAYQFLKHYAPLTGTSFLFIGDLSVADGLMPLGRYAINLLPIIMTVINVIAARIYTARTNPRSIISALNMAVIFLVLLYSSPAALVLYWTCNNLFSLGKNMLLARRKDDGIVPIRLSSLLATHIDQWITDKKKFIQSIVGIWGFAVYSLISFLFFSYNRKTGLLPNTLLGMAVCALIVSAAILCISHYKQHRKYTLCMLHIACIIAGILMLLYYAYIPISEIDLPEILLKLAACGILALPNVLWFPYFIRLAHRYGKTSTSYISQKSQPLQFYITLATLSVTSIVIFFTLPTEIFHNLPAEARISFSDIIIHNLPYFFAVIAGGILLYVLTPRRIRLWMVLSMVSMALILVSYALIIPFDLGPMDHFQLMIPQTIAPSSFFYIIEGIGLVLFVFWIHGSLRSHKKQLLAIILVCNIVAIGKFASTSIWAARQDAVAASPETQVDKKKHDKLPPDIFSFSQEKQNIVLIILDMANGGYMQRAMEENPSLSQIYRDFTWYPNTLSISTFTLASKPSMIGGWHYTPENIAKIPGTKLTEKILTSQDLLLQTFSSHQYKISMTGEHYVGYNKSLCSQLRRTNISCLEPSNKAIERIWLSNNPTAPRPKDTIAPDKKYAIHLNLAGLLRAVPIALKQRIYNKGTWNISSRKQIGYEFTLKEWGLIDSLANMSTIRDTASPNEQEENGTFTFIHSNSTHYPYALNSQCRLMRDELPDPNSKDNIAGDSPYFAFRCVMESLGKWFEWLRMHDAYDNTKIIIVSDHGNDVSDDPMNSNDIAPDMIGRAHPHIFTRLHVLLMIKDFSRANSQQQELQIDNRLMSNSDTASILYHSIEGYVPPANSHPDDLYDPTKIPPPSTRTIPSYHTGFDSWSEHEKLKEQFVIRDKYLVTDNIFEANNWKQIK